MKSALRRLQLRTRRRIFGETAGNHASRIRGEGYDFEQLRAYEPGDDVRLIDWKATAKLGEPTVRVMREDRELSVLAVVMASGSLFFGTRRLKQEVVAETVGLVGHSAVVSADRFRMLLWDGGVLWDGMGGKKLHHVARATAQVLEYEMQGRQGDGHDLGRQLAARLEHRSLIVLIGDFMTDVLSDTGVLGNRHEVVAVVVRDRLEEQPRYFGRETLLDPVTGERRTIRPGGAVYEKWFSAHEKALFEHFGRKGIRWVKIYTDEDPYERLVRLWL